MHDFACSNPHEMYNSELKQTAIKYKEQDGVATMCEILDEMRAESEEKGRIEGREEGRKEGVIVYIETLIDFGIHEDSEILRKVAEKFPNLLPEKAIDYLAEYKQSHS